MTTNLMEIDRFNARHTCRQFGFCEEHFLRADITEEREREDIIDPNRTREQSSLPDANAIREKPLVDCLRCMSHKATTLEIGLVQKPR